MEWLGTHDVPNIRCRLHAKGINLITSHVKLSMSPPQVRVQWGDGQGVKCHSHKTSTLRLQ